MSLTIWLSFVVVLSNAKTILCASDVRWYKRASTMTGSTLKADFHRDEFARVRDSTSGTDIQFHRTVYPSVCDLDDDGYSDIIVGVNGYVYYIKNLGNADKGIFEPPKKMKYSAGETGRWMRVGNSDTRAVCGDMNGDGLLDVVLTGGINGIAFKTVYYPNAATSRCQPTFATPLELLPSMPASVGVRFDVADWDSDGRLDIVIGPNQGPFAYYANIGSETSPVFQRDPTEIQQRYTTGFYHQPRAIDWDEDGHLDILYGTYFAGLGIKFVSIDKSAETYEESIHSIINGGEFRLMERVGRRVSADVADFNQDGTADLMVSGSDGKLIIFWGMPLSDRVQVLINDIDRTLQEHPRDLGTALEENASLSLSIQRTQDKLLEIANARNAMSESLKNYLFDKMMLLVGKHPHYLKRRRFESPYLAYFSGYMWTIMLEWRPDTVRHREVIATVTGHTGTLYDTLVNSGVLVVDNEGSSEKANRMLRDYMASLKVEYFWVERISMHGCIGETDRSQYHWNQLRKRSVNIFCRAETKRSDKASLPGCRICLEYGNRRGNAHISVIVHEIGHNSLRNLGSLASTESLRTRESILMHRVLKDCPDIKWMADRQVDIVATKAHFKLQGWYNSETEDFSDILKMYFNGHWVPNATNYQFNIITNVSPGLVLVNRRSEFFASIAQCWAQDSKMLLDIAVERFLDGYKENINQIIFLADYYSVDGSTTRFWMHNYNGDVYFFDVDVGRDVNDNIVFLSVPKATERNLSDEDRAYLVDVDPPHLYEFSVDGEGFVNAITNHPAYISSVDL